MAAQTFRRGKIEDYFHRLRVRKAVLKNQIEQKEFETLAAQIRGEIKALDHVIKELAEEFDIDYPDRIKTDSYPILEDAADKGDVIR